MEHVLVAHLSPLLSKYGLLDWTWPIDDTGFWFGSPAIAWAVVWLLELLCFPVMFAASLSISAIILQVVVCHCRLLWGWPCLLVLLKLALLRLCVTADCSVALELTSVLLEAAGGLELQTGENVGLLLSPCSEADFMVHRGALCCYAHMWDRLYFGICVLVLCCSKGYVRLLGLNKLVASSWSLSYAFCYRLRVMLVMLVFCSFC
uniref:Uncharacterized protein n=1 Tax=Populus alba TaxID=43335 RepID=A0A4U5P6L4_POPAL|nr:hypothetical protein D5086_0000217810 [Populus alba]